MTTVQMDDAEVWRADAEVYRAAMRKAFASVNTTAGTLLWVVDAATTEGAARIAWHDVVQFIRTHSDISLWSPAVMEETIPGADPDTVLDELFQLAQMIELGNDITDKLTKVQALFRS